MADSNALRCSICGTNKPQVQYSNQQLQDYKQRRRASAGSGRGQVAGPKCQGCYRPNNTEGARATTGNMVHADNIRCSNCGKTWHRKSYSNKQIQNWGQRVRAGYDRGKVEGPKCRACTGEPATEFDCYGCHKTLPRSSYNKTQLKARDKRLCNHCSQERQDREANPEDAEEEEAILEELESRAGGEDSVWGTAGMRSALSSTANSSAASTFASRADDGVWIVDAASQVSRDTARRSDPEDETAARMGSASNGTRGTGSWEHFPPLERRYPGPRGTGYSQVTNTNPGFAKQGAVKKTAEDRAQVRHQRNQLEKQKQKEVSEDEDDSDDSEDKDRDDDSDDGDEFEL